MCSGWPLQWLHHQLFIDKQSPHVVLQVLIEAGITKDMLDHSGRTPLLQAYKHQEFCERADTCKHHEMVQVGHSCNR
jgi:hypothetical protein